MNMENRNWIILAGTLVGYLVLMFCNPIRASMADGMRCVRRYGVLWSVLALFGFCYVAFQLCLRIYFHYVLPDEMRPIFQWHRAWFLPHGEVAQILSQTILPTAESVSGIFNNLLTTYPFSAFAAVLFLLNWECHLETLHKALRKRFGAAGTEVCVGIGFCALAAIVKPLTYILLPLADSTKLDPELVLQVSTIIDWLSFVFEYLFGVCIQLYLILLVYAWVRGLNFTHRHMLDFAIRRLGSVMKWAALVTVISSLFIHLPLVLSNLPWFAERFPTELVLDYIDRFARPFLAVLLLLFSTVQITLTFHSESLRKAIADHFRFLAHQWHRLGWFLAIAGIHFFALNFVNTLFLRALGEGTAIVIAWELLFPLLEALLAAWLLASWVCLFKRCQAGTIDTDNWIPLHGAPEA